MTLLSLALLVFAARLHALSTALIKISRDKLAFSWWMLTAWVIIGFPLILFVGQPQPIGWLIILVSGLIAAVCFITLTRACTLGDLSQMYLLARGSAPLFLGKAGRRRDLVHCAGWLTSERVVVTYKRLFIY